MIFRQKHVLRPLLLFLFATTSVLYWLTLREENLFRHQLIPPSSTGASSDLASPEAAFVSWPLARVCNEATWQPGLVFICDINTGGIGNIRGYILTCMRYAIAAGAPGLVLPRIRERSSHNISELVGTLNNFTYFFDAAHFRNGLRTACPQITLYDTDEAIPYARKEQFVRPAPPNPDPPPANSSRTPALKPRSPFPEFIRPKGFFNRSFCDVRDLNRQTDLFGLKFRQWVDMTAKDFLLPPVDPQHPRIIHLHWGVQLEWPIWHDGPEFANTFGGLLRLRPDILALGKRTAEAMRAWAAARAPWGSAPGYAGVHLRTENDILAHWLRYDDQATAYLERISTLNLKAVFLATGNQTEAAKFAEQAKKEIGVAVVSKHDLLPTSSPDRKALDALTWDQQALVDYIVLLESAYFLGVSPSSFSMSVALKRHLHAEGLYTRPWKIGGEGDGRSWLVGNYDNYWENWLYMYESIWP